jgi:membrane protein required for colicin V production
MNGLDWLIVAIMVLSVMLAAAQGFFFELFSLAGAIAGYVLAAWQYPMVAAFYSPYVKQPWVADAAGFLTIFFAVLLLGGFAGRLARWMFAEAGLRWFDRMLGAAFGLARGALVATVVVMAMAAFSPGAQMLRGSLLGPYFLVAGQAASWMAPQSLRQSFRDGVKALRGIQPSKPTAAQPHPADGAR